MLKKITSRVNEIATKNLARRLEEIDVVVVSGKVDSHLNLANTNAHNMSNIAGLNIVLDSKSDIGHTQPISSIDGLITALSGKANIFTGYSGNLVVMTSPTVSKTIVISNGIITGII